MLPDLEKICAADRQARGAAAAAQEEAQSLLEEARAQVKVIQANLEVELAQLQKTVQEEILQQAEGRAALVAGATEKFLQELKAKQAAHGEEAVALLVSRVLAE
jgi:vacuolar-type H+-ATPase subunit H